MENTTFKPKLLHRVRLQKQLKTIYEVPLLVISASMGYGKTTVVKDFLKNRKDLISLWFTFNTNETDSEWMWNKFCSAVRELSPDISDKLYEYGIPNTTKEAEYIVMNIRNKIKRPIVLILDDYHENKSNKFNELLITFVKAEIEDFHIILISRTMPPFPVQEFQLKNLCKVLSQNDLEFTFQEIHELFKLNGFLLESEEQKLLHKNTEGWTSAIYLGLLRYSETRNVDKDINIKYLMKTAVYDKLDTETQTVLLKLCIFESVTLEAAVYVTENKEAGKFIHKLLEDNCFLRYDAKNDVYIIHAILRELLKEILNTSGIDKASLFSRYAHWHEQKGNIIEAIESYYKAGNYIKILDIFELKGATEFIDLAPKTIFKAFEAMELKLKIARPIAYISFIFSYLIVVNGEKGAEFLMEAKAIYEKDENLLNKKEVLAEIAIVESFLYFNDIKLMSECYKKAYELFDGKKSHIMCPEMVFSLGSPNLLYLYHKEVGGLKSLVEAMISSAMRCYQRISNGNGTGCEYIVQAEYYLEIGDLKNAEFYAHKGIFKAKTKEQASIIICGNLCLSRAAMLRGQPTTAFFILDELKKYIEKIKNPYLYNSMEIAEAIVYGSLGIVSKSTEWLSIDNISNFRKIYLQRLGIACIAMGKSAIVRKSYIELEVIVETIREVCEEHNNFLGYIYAGIYLSIAKYHLYDLETAMKEFRQTVKLAEADKIVSPFVESMPEIEILLKEFQREGSSKWIDKVIEMSSKFMKAYEEVHKKEENITLTARESKVLALLENGYKQSEIAQELIISPNTVRRHLQNIYNKLGVTNKTLALKKIHELNVGVAVENTEPCMINIDKKE